MLFHVFAHVNTHQRVLVVEQFHGKRLRKFSLAHTRRAQEQEATNRRILAAKTATVTQYRFRNRFHSFVLANHAGMQAFVQVQQLGLFAFAKLGHRNSGPAAHHKGDGFFRHLFAQVAVAGGLLDFFRLRGDFLFEVHNLVVLEFGGAVQVVAGFGLLHLVLRLLQGLLEALQLGVFRAPLLPTVLHQLDCSIRRRQLFTQLFQAFYAGVVGFLRQGLLLDFHLEFLTLQGVQGFGHRIHLRLHKACGFINQVDGLVRQETVTDIAVRKFHGSHERVVVQTHAMVRIESVLDATENRNRFLFAGLVNLHGLETAFQGGILLNVLAVFLRGGRTDAVQFTTGELRLEHIAQVHGAFRLARTHNGVDFVDEQQGIAVFFKGVQHGFQTFLEIATVFCTRHQGRQIQRKQLLALQSVRHIAAIDSLGEPFDNSGLTHARFTDQARVVFRLTAQNQDDTADFFFTANHRRKLSVGGHFHEFTAVQFQRGLFLGIGGPCKRIRKPSFHDLDAAQRVFEHLRKATVARELHEGHEHIARGHHTVHLTRRLHRGSQNAVQVIIGFHVGVHALHARNLLHERLQLAAELIRLRALRLVEFLQGGIRAFDKAYRQVRRTQVGMRATVAQALRLRQNFFCIVVKIRHITSVRLYRRNRTYDFASLSRSRLVNTRCFSLTLTTLRCAKPVPRVVFVKKRPK